MPGNDFENKVRMQMQQLTLSPQPAVWDGVEKLLLKKRKRRFVFYWIFSLGILVGLSYFCYLESNTNKIITTNVERNTNRNIHSSPKSTTEHTGTNKLDTLEECQTSQTRKNNLFSINKIIARKTKQRNSESAFIPPSETIKFSLTEDKQKIKDRILTNASIQKVRMTTLIGLHPPCYPLYNFKDSVIRKVPSSSKAKWGWEIGMGQAMIRSGSPNLNYASNSLATSPISSSGLFVKQETINPGGYFSTGPWMRRSISNRWQLRTSLQYQFISNIMKVGVPGTTPFQISNTSSSRSYTIDNYFSSGNDLSYKTIHHLLETSLNIERTMGRKKRSRWEAGIALRINLQDNEISYDVFRTIYYSQPSHFNKQQWSLSTGSSFDILHINKKKAEWGWRFYYDLTPFTNYNHVEKLSRMGLGLYLRK